MVLRWHRVAPVAKLHDHLCPEQNDALPPRHSPRPHDSRRALFVGPMRTFGNNYIHPHRLLLIAKTLHWPAIPVLKFTAAPDSTLSSWALLSMHVALPCPSRVIGLNVPGGQGFEVKV